MPISGSGETVVSSFSFHAVALFGMDQNSLPQTRRVTCKSNAELGDITHHRRASRWAGTGTASAPELAMRDGVR